MSKTGNENRILSAFVLDARRRTTERSAPAGIRNRSKTVALASFAAEVRRPGVPRANDVSEGDVGRRTTERSAPAGI